MKETVEHNNRFYGEELKTESEQLKEWLIVANKEIERLNNIINELEKDIRETIGLLKKQNCQEISKDYFIETLDIYCSRLKDVYKE